MTKRSPWFRIAATLSGMVIVLLLAASFRYVQSRGVFASVEDKTPGQCRAVAGISDVTALSAGNKGALFIATKNGLHLYTNGKAVPLTGTPKDFHPATLSYAEGALRVLFRQGGAWKISRFGFKDSTTLEEQDRLTTDELTDPADLVSVDGAHFYLVNLSEAKTALGRWLDDAFLLPRAKILYFDGMKFQPVAERLNTPSGLALSRDTGRLYVSQGWPRNLVRFTRNQYVGTLDNAALLSLSAAPGKMTVAEDGSLIVAATPKAGQGAVYRVSLSNGALQKAELLYGSKSQAVTAAAELGKHLLIGTGGKLLDCAP